MSTLRTLVKALTSVFVLSFACASVADAKTLLVFAPHPDDEALMASGIIYAALARGDMVKVVLMTNGDSGGNVASTALGILRQGETVAGMSVLGLTEPNIIFLGYGDETLLQVQESTSPTAVLTSNAGQSQTYGSRGLGETDYHNYLTGTHGAYNQATLLADVKAVLQNFRPDEIYTTGSWDAHPDHQATLLFLAQAILSLRNGGMSFSPKLYATIIHAPSDGYASVGVNSWPWPPFTPLQPLSAPHGLNVTPLNWNQAINFPVPQAMQSTNPAANIKEQAINAYQSQVALTNNWLFSFVKKDEAFWLYDYATNLALNASVTDSSEAPGQAGTAAVNGVVDGYPNNFSQEWASVHQLSGAWIQLNWAQPVTTSLIVLHDRPNTIDNVQAGTLLFSDGSSVPVGTLPDNGNGVPFTFSPKTIAWVRFTVTQARGLNTGLSEMEVYGTPSGSTTNYPPRFTFGPVSSPNVVNSSDTSNLSLSAFDANANPLHYSWSADAGSIAGSGPTAVFTPPASNSTPVFTITATVNDGRGGTAVNSTFVSANAPSALSLSPASVLGGGNSQATVTLLGPAPASGAVVSLSSSDSSTTVPATVTVPGNSTSTTFTVNTSVVSAMVSVTISASYGDQTQTAILTVNPIVVTLSLNPTTVIGGNPSQGAVSLSAAAPTGGLAVTLSSDNIAVATLPPSVTIPAGSTSATFTVNTSSVAAITTVTITASYGTSVDPDPLTVNPPQTGNQDVALIASVTDSSENASTGQLGIRAIDGVIAGYPGDYTKEWATLGQLAGAWIQLNWSSPVQVSQIVLWDRPNLGDNVLAGTLNFSDGTNLAVGQLPNDASSGYTVSFATKSINWVKFTVTQAVGFNIGLAEFQVFGSGGGGGGVASGLTLNPSTVVGGSTSQGTVTLTGAAPTGGAVVTLTSSKTSVATVPASVTVPAGSASATFAVTTLTVSTSAKLSISASFGGATVKSILAVTPQADLALSATVTDSSETASTGQLGIKAIDGVIDGYPGDSTREWATQGKLVGAWIQLTWSSPVKVSQVVLWDRPNLSDNVLAGTLSFSDGSTVPVGQLPNDGSSGYTVSFSTKTITRVRFTITQAVGFNIGLAEFQVLQ